MSILVPNHLSTVKNYQSTPSITHPKSTKPPKKSLPKSINHTRNGGKVKKRVAAGVKKVKRGADDHSRRRKRGLEKVREVHIDTNP